MKLPSYSVVIPAYNAENLLEETVLSALNQTYAPLEIIIVNDNSTDNTEKIISKLKEKSSIIKSYTNSENLGVADTRNFAFTKVSGDLVALLDSDDIWAPEKQEKQISMMTENKCDFSYTGYSFLDTNGVEKENVYYIPKSISYNSLLKENYIGCSSVILSREITINYKMKNNYSHEDYVFWLELLKDGNKACGIDLPLMKYRVSPDSRSGNKIKAANSRWKVYRDFLKFGRIKSLYFFVHYGIRSIRKRW